MIVVVGVGRTGTTAVARVLQERMGVDMGGPGDTSIHSDGSYEDPRLRGHTLRLTHGTIRPLDWLAVMEGEPSRRKGPWGYKDPLLWQFVPLMLAAWPDASVVWADRAPKPTIASWIDNRVGGFSEARIRDEVRGRRWTIERALAKRKHTRIDMTEWRTDQEIEAALKPAARPAAAGGAGVGFRPIEDAPPPHLRRRIAT